MSSRVHVPGWARLCAVPPALLPPPPQTHAPPRLIPAPAWRRPVAVQIVAARCLTAPDAAKRTLAVQVALGPDAAYGAGDAVGVVCPNDASTVDALLNRLGLLDRQVRHALGCVVRVDDHRRIRLMRCGGGTGGGRTNGASTRS